MIWSGIIGSLFILTLLYFTFTILIIPQVINHRKERQRQQHKTAQKEYQDELLQRWGSSKSAKVYTEFLALEQVVKNRKTDLQLKLNETLSRKKKYESYSASDVPLVQEGAQKELEQLNEVINKRQSAIKIYSNSLELIHFQKEIITDKKVDFLKGKNTNNANNELHDAFNIGRDISIECSNIELDLKNLHDTNKYGSDENFDTMDELELVENPQLLKDSIFNIKLLE